jgi:hypothetical protein
MGNISKPTIIRVSFKHDEMQLYNDIMQYCNLIGLSGWMKQAALEKLERDKDKKANYTNVNKSNNNTPVINSMDQLFK